MDILAYIFLVFNAALFTAEHRDGAQAQCLDQGATRASSLPVQTTQEPAFVYPFTQILLRDLNCLSTSCDTLVIQRPKRDQRFYLDFPQGGTQTAVYLYELQRFLAVRADPMELDYAVLRYDGATITSGQSLVLNLAGLEDGYYMISYLSCSMASEIRLQLTTERP